MPRLTRITVQGLKAHRRQLSLDVPRFLALEGPNGTGKSALLQAVRLGVLGYEPQLGKTLELTRQVVSHGASEIDVTLQFDTGFAVRRRLGASMEIDVHPTKGERLLKEKQSRIDKELGSFVPSFDMHEFIGRSAEKRREYLLDMLPRTDVLDAEKWRQWLGYAEADATIQKGIDWLWTEKVLKSPTLLDGLATALRETGEQVRSAVKAVQDQEVVAARASADAIKAAGSMPYDARRLLELQEDLHQAEQEHAQLRSAADQAERAGTELRQREHHASVLAMRKEQAEQQVARLSAEADSITLPSPETIEAALTEAAHAERKASSQRDAVRYNGEKVSAAQATLVAARQTLQSVAQALAGIATHAACPICGSVAELERARTTLREKEAEARAAHEAAANAVRTTQSGLDAAEQLQRELDARAKSTATALQLLREQAASKVAAASKLAAATQRLAEILEEIAAAETLPPIEIAEPDPAAFQAARRRVSELQSAIVAEQAAAREAGRGDADRERADRERQTLEKWTGRADRLKELLAAQKRLRAHVIEVLVGPLEQSANRLLQAIDPGKEFRFLFEREDKLDFDFGFIEDGVFRSYDAASTGEDAFLVVVLVAALVEVVQPAWRCVLLDNVELIDDQRRRFFMLALAEHEDLFDNVIIAGCCKFADVEGWAVVSPAPQISRASAA